MELFTFDDEYVRRLREGDPATVEHFVAYERKVLGIKLRGRYLPPDSVEDATQETLLRVLEAVRQGRVTDGHSFGGYVNGTCNHVLSEQTRKTWREDQLDDVRHDRPSADSQVDDVIKDELKALIRKYLDTLPAKDAKLLKDVYLDERNKQEVCAELGVSAEYLRVLIHRALAKLREKFVTKPGPPSLHR